MDGEDKHLRRPGMTSLGHPLHRSIGEGSVWSSRGSTANGGSAILHSLLSQYEGSVQSSQVFQEGSDRKRFYTRPWNTGMRRKQLAQLRVGRPQPAVLIEEKRIDDTHWLSKGIVGSTSASRLVGPHTPAKFLLEHAKRRTDQSFRIDAKRTFRPRQWEHTYETRLRTAYFQKASRSTCPLQPLQPPVPSVEELPIFVSNFADTETTIRPFTLDLTDASRSSQTFKARKRRTRSRLGRAAPNLAPSILTRKLSAKSLRERAEISHKKKLKKKLKQKRQRGVYTLSIAGVESIVERSGSGYTRPQTAPIAGIL